MTDRVKRDRGAIAFAEQLLTVLEEGSFTATYKYAVILALLDLCLEHSTRAGAAPSSLSRTSLFEASAEFLLRSVRVRNSATAAAFGLFSKSCRVP